MKTLTEIQKYDSFIYDKFNITYKEKTILIEYFYEILNLKKFVHKIEIPVSNKDVDKDYVEKLAFNIGLLELVSYYKLTIAPNIIINCGSITKEQEDFFRKIYFYGLGEFFYLNGLNPDYDNFITFNCRGPEYNKTINYNGNGSLIAIGGGKDSCVTLSLMSKDNNKCFIINPKEVMIDCANAAGYYDDDIIAITRTMDKGLIKLNQEGFLNGHTPFSAMVAFVSYLAAYLNGKKYIVLSNESSANESNVAGTKINHQYSKSYEFELDFQNYANKYLGKDIFYYSLLRPLTEYQIGMIFAKNKKYHQIFKSCNVGSKENPWIWCGHCSKCLFVYSLLSPFLYKNELVNIFGHDLFEDESLLITFRELLGKINTKPFDCVGTFEEVNYAITKTIKNLDNEKLPFLLKYYKENYYDENILKLNLESFYNDENSLKKEDIIIIKGALK